MFIFHPTRTDVRIYAALIVALVIGLATTSVLTYQSSTPLREARSAETVRAGIAFWKNEQSGLLQLCSDIPSRIDCGEVAANAFRERQNGVWRAPRHEKAGTLLGTSIMTFVLAIGAIVLGGCFFRDYRQKIWYGDGHKLA